MQNNAVTVTSRIIGTKDLNWRNFQIIQQDDFKELSAIASDKLRQSILTNQFSQPFYVWQSPEGVDYCLDGFHRIKELKRLEAEGYDIPELLPSTLINCENKQEAAKLVLMFSSAYAKVTEQGLTGFIDMYELDWAEIKGTIDLPELDVEAFGALFTEADKAIDPVNVLSLSDRFLIPPFSVFDTRQGYWQDRKKAWHALGFNSQETREDIELVAKSGQAPAIYALRNKMREELKREPTWDEIIAEAKAKGMHIYEGASVFDPVLAEVCYKWFCPPAGIILDPFAGGSVRGIVAGRLGCHYEGIDLRADQCQANREQWSKLPDLPGEGVVSWIVGDSNVVLETAIDKTFDFVFSCPPYHDLEQYSEDPADLSNMDYPEFISIYRSIIEKSVAKLKENRFACFVVGDIRDKDGFYRDFVGDTVQAFRHAGMQLYNEIILINVAGSLPVRIGRQFGGYRKVGKMHQNVLVFYKGDPKAIKDNFPEIEVADLEAEFKTPEGVEQL